MQYEESFFAIIYIGSKERYEGKAHTKKEIEDILKEYCNNNSLCVSLKEIEFIYKDGYEFGFEITLINYPRFPSSKEEITNKAISIAEILKNKLNQYRVSIMCQDKTYII
jgi:hypothetical protein